MVLFFKKIGLGVIYLILLSFELHFRLYVIKKGDTTEFDMCDGGVITNDPYISDNLPSLAPLRRRP